MASDSFAGLEFHLIKIRTVKIAVGEVTVFESDIGKA
jgi:hypothetical protein